MLERVSPGHIVNTASFSGSQGHHSQGAYGTSKFAAVGFSEFLRNDLEGTNVSASVLCPHVVDTPIFYPDLKPTEITKIQERREQMPWLKEIAVSPDTVGEQVVAGVRNNELYIFCDGSDSRKMLETTQASVFGFMCGQQPGHNNDTASNRPKFSQPIKKFPQHAVHISPTVRSEHRLTGMFSSGRTSLAAGLDQHLIH